MSTNQQNEQRDPVEAQPRWATFTRTVIFFRGQLISARGAPGDPMATNMYQGMEILPFREKLEGSKNRYLQAVVEDYDIKIDRLALSATMVTTPENEARMIKYPRIRTGAYNLSGVSVRTAQNDFALIRYIQLREKETASPATITDDERTELAGIRAEMQDRLFYIAALQAAATLIGAACSLEELSRISVNWSNGTASLDAARATTRSSDPNVYQLSDSDRLPLFDFGSGYIGYDAPSNVPNVPPEPAAGQ